MDETFDSAGSSGSTHQPPAVSDSHLPPWRWLAVALVTVVAAVALATPVTDALVSLTGGQSRPESTALAIANESAANGVRQGKPLRFTITNDSDHDRTYTWQASVAGTEIDSATVDVAAGKTVEARVATGDIDPGSILDVSLADMPQRLRIRILAPEIPS